VGAITVPDKFPLNVPVKFWCEECNETIEFETAGFCSDMFCNPDGDSTIWYPEVRDGMCSGFYEAMDNDEELPDHHWYMVLVEGHDDGT
jgi:hypothetical protein